jgi:hypothetical protein
VRNDGEGAADVDGRKPAGLRFKDEIRNLTQRRAPVTLRDMIEAINPIIRGWGNYYRKANVRKLFHRLDGWMKRRLWSFILATDFSRGTA